MDFTIYLLDKNKTYDSYIRNDIDVEHRNADWSSNIKGKFFFSITKNNDLEWIKVINQEIHGSPIKQKPVHKHSGVFICKIKSSNKNFTLALSFSNGIKLINNEDISRDFGLVVTKKILDNTSINSTYYKEISSNISINKKHNYRLPEHAYYQNSFDHYFFKTIKGKAHLNSLKFREKKISLEGGRGIKIDSPINFSKEIKELLIDLCEIYMKKHSKIKGINENITTDIEKFEKENFLVNLLNYFKDLNQKNINEIKCNTYLSFSFPDNTKWIKIFMSRKKIDELKLKDEAINSSDLGSDSVLQKIVSKLFSENKELSFESMYRKLKRFYVFYELENNPDVIEKTNIYNCLSIGFNDSKNEQYLFLENGMLHKLNKDFKNSLITSINQVKNYDLSFPNYIKRLNSQDKNKFSEKNYNEYLKETINSNPDLTAIFLDENKYQYSEGYSRIEICDVYFYNKVDQTHNLIHVKRNKSAGGISHLMSQAISSTEMLISSNYNFLNHFNKFIIDNGLSPIDNNILPKNINIITLLINEKKGDSLKENNTFLTLLKTFPILNAQNNLTNKGVNFFLNFVHSNYD